MALRGALAGNSVTSSPPLGSAKTGVTLGHRAAIAQYLATEQEGIATAQLKQKPGTESFIRFHDGPAPRGLVVLFHGLSSSPAQWREEADRLFLQGYDVFVPRLPGHGLLNPDGTQNVEHVPTGANWKEWDQFEMAIYAATKQAPSLTLLGVSCGGMLALKMAARHGTRRNAAKQPWLKQVVVASPFLKFGGASKPKSKGAQVSMLNSSAAKWARWADQFAPVGFLDAILRTEGRGIPSRLSAVPSGFRVLDQAMALGLDLATDEVRQATNRLKHVNIGVLASLSDPLADPQAMVAFGNKIGARLKVFEASREVPHAMVNAIESPTAPIAEIDATIDAWLGPSK